MLNEVNLWLRWFNMPVQVNQMTFGVLGQSQRLMGWLQRLPGAAAYGKYLKASPYIHFLLGSAQGMIDRPDNKGMEALLGALTGDARPDDLKPKTGQDAGVLVGNALAWSAIGGPVGAALGVGLGAGALMYKSHERYEASQQELISAMQGMVKIQKELQKADQAAAADYQRLVNDPKYRAVQYKQHRLAMANALEAYNRIAAEARQVLVTTKGSADEAQWTMNFWWEIYHRNNLSLARIARAEREAAEALQATMSKSQTPVLTAGQQRRVTQINERWGTMSQAEKDLALLELQKMGIFTRQERQLIDAYQKEMERRRQKK
jgi:hypothetical protein